METPSSTGLPFPASGGSAKQITRANGTHSSPSLLGIARTKTRPRSPELPTTLVAHANAVLLANPPSCSSPKKIKNKINQAKKDESIPQGETLQKVVYLAAQRSYSSPEMLVVNEDYKPQMSQTFGFKQTPSPLAKENSTEDSTTGGLLSSTSSLSPISSQSSSELTNYAEAPKVDIRRSYPPRHKKAAAPATQRRKSEEASLLGYDKIRLDTLLWELKYKKEQQRKKDNELKVPSLPSIPLNQPHALPPPPSQTKDSLYRESDEEWAGQGIVE